MKDPEYYAAYSIPSTAHTTSATASYASTADLLKVLVSMSVGQFW